MTPTPLLEARGLVRHYRLPRERLLAAAPVVQALRGVDFSLPPGRSLGVVGESGSGKSTLARLAMALEAPTAGQVLFDGQDLSTLTPSELRRARAGFQMVFQDPFGSLDPRQPVWRTVSEPLAAQDRSAGRAQRRDAAARTLESVGLRPADADKYPHEFSGGQRQRIAIARALVTEPRLIVADEPVSALDVSVQAQVLNLMMDLQERLSIGFLFISHDLAVVDLVCDDVIVLYQGRVVEQGSPDTLFVAAGHPYTRALIDAVPRAAPQTGGSAATRRTALAAQRAQAAPTAGPLPVGAAAACSFAPRCAFRQDRCLIEAPILRPLALQAHPAALATSAPGTHLAACHFAEAVAAASASAFTAATSLSANAPSKEPT